MVLDFMISLHEPRRPVRSVLGIAVPTSERVAAWQCSFLPSDLFPRRGERFVSRRHTPCVARGCPVAGCEGGGVQV